MTSFASSPTPTQMNEAIEYFTKPRPRRPHPLHPQEAGQHLLRAGQVRARDRDVQAPDRRLAQRPPRTTPSYQVEVINAYKKMGQREKVLAEINVPAHRLRAGELLGPRPMPNNTDELKPRLEEKPSSCSCARSRCSTTTRATAVREEPSRVDDANKLFDLAKQRVQDLPRALPEQRARLRGALRLRRAALQDQGPRGRLRRVHDRGRSIDPKGKHSLFCAESAVFAAEEQIKLEGGGDATSAR